MQKKSPSPKKKYSDFDGLSLWKNEIGVLLSFVCQMSTKERYHGFWLVQLWPGKEEDFLDTSQFQPISKWKEYGFLWIRICCGFALILLVWIEKDYSFSFWSVSDKSQFTLTKHDRTIMGKGALFLQSMCTSKGSRLWVIDGCSYY